VFLIRGLCAVAIFLAAAVAQAAPNGWQATIDRVTPAVVVIRVNSPRAFDGGTTGYAVATGFVVDAERGLILTNRHVVTPGPVVAEAVFLDNEEVDVRAVYRDPVHDFGIFRFDPADVQFMDLAELALHPEGAQVGTEIRVIGNDAGEKLSILAGTIARLDRPAPRYGANTYNDFNTFYIQAASGTSGGSSGSPVVDLEGRAVAINAGGARMAASSFYLPLDRVARALDLIQRGEPVTRGTLQTVFRHLPYDEIRRLKLRRETEKAVRKAFPDGTGMIVVAEIVPGGPAGGVLAPGDVVVNIGGRGVNAFIPIEAVLDDSVGGTVVLDIERAGVPMTVELEVDDLHAISADEYLEVGGAVLNRLSYQQARNQSVPVGGVQVASEGYMLSRAGLPRGSVIVSVGGQPTPDLDSFEAALAAHPDGTRVPLRFWVPGQSRSPMVSVVKVDRRWFTMQRCRRDDASGTWPCRPSPDAPAPQPAEPASTDFVLQGEKAQRAVTPSLVLVDFDIPYRIDGVHGDRFRGAGLVIDAERGLVVVDRETVPVALGDLSLTFASSVQIPGEVVYLHPEHNLAIIRYDPALIGDTPVVSATLRDARLDPGDDVWLVGMTASERLVTRHTRVARKEPLQLPIPYPPRFRESNIEVVTLDDSASSVGGVLTDKKGRVHALWASFTASSGSGNESFFAGIPVRAVRELLEPLAKGEPVGRRSLGVELRPLTLADARDRGLPEPQAKRLEKHDRKARSVLSVLRLTAGHPASDVLRSGDLILEIDGEPVTAFREVERASQRDRIAMRVLRDGELLDLDVPTEAVGGVGTTEALLWAGTLLQAPPRALAAQRGLPREGVYVSRFWFGSPANRYGVQATRRIIEIDGQPTPDLDAFLAAVKGRPDRSGVLLRTIDLDGKIDAITLRIDLEYWPTFILRRGEAGWTRIAVDPAPEANTDAVPDASDDAAPDANDDVAPDAARDEAA